MEELPTETDNLSLGFKINYVQSEDTGIEVLDNGIIKVATADGSLDDIGTIVTIGSEQFYTIGTEGNNVKLLSMYNLYVGGEYNANTGVYKEYGDEATGIQDSTMLGYISGQSIYKGTILFSTDEEKGVNYNDYNGSIAERYVNHYKMLLEEDYRVSIIEARLITYDELIDPSTFACEGGDYCRNYEWISSTSYWTGSAGYSSDMVWFVKYGGFFESDIRYGEIYGYGVRPVIVIPKNEIVVNDSGTTKQLIEFTIDGITYQAEDGMTWLEWEDSIYNTKNISIDRQCGNYVGKNGSINLNDLIENLDVLTYESSAVCGGGSN